MGRSWLKRTIIPVILTWFTGAMSLANGVQDIHLDVTPRTATEAAWVARVTAPTLDFTAPEALEQNPGGAGTIHGQTGQDAFSQPSANLSFEQVLDFRAGNGLFRKVWLPSEGLGPLFNARSCQLCHIRDGRGHPPEGPDDTAVSMFLRVSIPTDEGIAEIEDYIATTGDPTYGQQLQDFALPGHDAEYQLQVSYQSREIHLNGGEIVMLQVPTYSVDDPGYGPLHKDATLSPRVAPQLIGLGLLEAIPAADILAGVDVDDANGDGISGRANIVWSAEFDQPMLGRFGLKAGLATVYHQTAAAFANDMGLSNPLIPDPWGDCTSRQKDCREAPHGGDERGDETRSTEIDDIGMDLLAFYSRNLAVPARRDLDLRQVLRGKELFYQTGCTACHRPKFVTHRLNNRPEQSFQVIWPYSDMLLHDMGEGLADRSPESRATGREWRTPPLWGIGLTKAVSGHTRFLHDGRARNLLEAILWHGGEAERTKQAVVAMPQADRAALIRFLESL